MSSASTDAGVEAAAAAPAPPPAPAAETSPSPAPPPPETPAPPPVAPEVIRGWRWRALVIVLGVFCACLCALTVWLWFRTHGHGKSSATAENATAESSAETTPQQVSVKFVKRDDKRGGAWKKDLGKDGYIIYNRNGVGQHDQRLPPYIQELTCSGANSHVFAQNDDPRGLQDGGQTATRFSTCQYTDGEMVFSIHAKRLLPYRLALYCLDFDRSGRMQRVELVSDEKVLHTQDVEKMGEGTWLHYEVCGSIDIRLRNIGPNNAVLAGIFFDDLGARALPSRLPPKGPPPSGEAAVQPGLWAEFFDGLGTYANANDKPLLKRVVSSLNFGSMPNPPPGGRSLRGWPLSGQCAAIFSGFVKIPKNDTYTFFVESDDGAKLYINGAVVVNGDGIHPMQEASGQVDLPAGLQRFWLEYFNAGGGMGLNVSIKAKDGNRQPLRAELLCYDPAETEMGR